MADENGRQAVRGDDNEHSLPTTSVMVDPETMGTAADIASGVFSSEYEIKGIPTDWKERARKAWEYYIEEPIVSNTINTWRTFAIGDQVKIISDDDTVRVEAQALFQALDVNRFLKDMILQLLVKGDCVGYKRYGSGGKASKGEHNDIVQALCLNPTSVDFEVESGELVRALQKPDADGGGSVEETELPLAQLIHRKWNAPQFSVRGNSMVTPAFESIELLRDYRRAQRAIAKRWTTPLRFILVGGKYGDKVIMPTQKMITAIRDQINKMDMKSGLVVPFYVHAETYGTEGQVLNTEDKVKEVKEDLIVALGVAKSLVTGDGPNFATASIAFQKMVIMLKEIKQVAREILDWIFEDWKVMKGYGDKKLQYIFSDVDLTNEVEVKKLLIELYDRNLISKNTIQTKMDLNPDVERSNRTKEGTLVDMSWDIKDIVSLVQMGVMSVDTAREMLGLDGAKETGRVKVEVKSDAEGMYATADEGKTCDGCAFFDAENNRCQVTDEERRFDQPVCRQFLKAELETVH